MADRGQRTQFQDGEQLGRCSSARWCRRVAQVGGGGCMRPLLRSLGFSLSTTSHRKPDLKRSGQNDGDSTTRWLTGRTLAQAQHGHDEQLSAWPSDASRPLLLLHSGARTCSHLHSPRHLALLLSRPRLHVSTPTSSFGRGHCPLPLRVFGVLFLPLLRRVFHLNTLTLHSCERGGDRT